MLEFVGDDKESFRSYNNYALAMTLTWCRKETAYRVRYRVGKERSHEIIATEKICQKKIADLKQEHGTMLNFSKW